MAGKFFFQDKRSGPYNQYHNEKIILYSLLLTNLRSALTLRTTTQVGIAAWYPKNGKNISALRARSDNTAGSWGVDCRASISPQICLEQNCKNNFLMAKMVKT